MKTYLECIPCFMQQAYRAAKFATHDEEIIKQVLDSTGEMIKTISLNATPPETGNFIYKNIRDITLNNDPYKDIKKANINEALKLYPDLKKQIEKSEDQLLTAIRIAIAGNVIDLGVNKSFNIIEDLHKILKQDFAAFDYDAFKEHLHKVKSILYIGDNAGESVFDRLLIETISKPTTFVVREVPVINDCIKEDAVASGLDKAAEIISSGSTAPATILSLCNSSFIEKFNQADLVISKGQGNYEGLSEVSRPVFFLLKAKCKVIARDLGVNENDIVLKGINIDS
ncbi:MAG: damage-control phosphatase ARMT1 family protein [Thiohalospira sp.]